MGAPGAGICEAQALVLLALLCLGVRNSKKEPPLAPASTSSPGSFQKEPRCFLKRTATPVLFAVLFARFFCSVLLCGSFFYFLAL